MPKPDEDTAPLAIPETNAVPTPSNASFPSITLDATCTTLLIMPQSKLPTTICQSSPLLSERITGLLSQYEYKFLSVSPNGEANNRLALSGLRSLPTLGS